MSHSILSIKLTAFALLLLSAAVLDVRDRRLPNALTGTGALVGLVFGIVEAHGLPLSALAGMALGLGIGFPLFALGALGAGDAKLLAAVGAFLGPAGLVLTALYGGVAGGLLTLLWSLRTGTIAPVLLATQNLMVWVVTLGRAGQRRTLDTSGDSAVPYGVAIAAGGLAAWFFPSLLEGLL